MNKNVLLLVHIKQKKEFVPLIHTHSLTHLKIPQRVYRSKGQVGRSGEKFVFQVLVRLCSTNTSGKSDSSYLENAIIRVCTPKKTLWMRAWNQNLSCYNGKYSNKWSDTPKLCHLYSRQNTMPSNCNCDLREERLRALRAGIRGVRTPGFILYWELAQQDQRHQLFSVMFTPLKINEMSCFCWETGAGRFGTAVCLFFTELWLHDKIPHVEIQLEGTDVVPCRDRGHRF